jgi:hypothetical protein
VYVVVCDVVTAQVVAFVANVEGWEMIVRAAIRLKLRMNAGNVLAFVQRRMRALHGAVDGSVSLALPFVIFDRGANVYGLPFELNYAAARGSPLTCHR